MYGPSSEETVSRAVSQKTMNDPNLIGIIPRVIQEIFEYSEYNSIINLTVYCSFVQIYNENLYDLLR